MAHIPACVSVQSTKHWRIGHSTKPKNTYPNLKFKWVLSHAAVHPTLRGGHFLGRLPKVEKFVCYIDWKISFWTTILPIYGKTAQSWKSILLSGWEIFFWATILPIFGKAAQSWKSCLLYRLENIFLGDYTPSYMEGRPKLTVLIAVAFLVQVRTRVWAGSSLCVWEKPVLKENLF